MKSRKLKCIITGKSLTATPDYYSKKLEKAGSEEELHRTYICKEAKDLLLKGLNVEQVRKQLGVTDKVDNVPEDIINSITTNEYGLKRNTMFNGLTSFRQETDSDVKAFINKLYDE